MVKERIRILSIDSIEFDAAHYIPGHPKCGCIHGHTFFVRNLRVYCNKFVDFGKIKEEIRHWDHILVIPKKHMDFWYSKINPLLHEIGINQCFMIVDGEPSVEDISDLIVAQLKTIPGVVDVHFTLCEGPHQRVEGFE